MADGGEGLVVRPLGLQMPSKKLLDAPKNHPKDPQIYLLRRLYKEVVEL